MPVYPGTPRHLFRLGSWRCAYAKHVRNTKLEWRILAKVPPITLGLDRREVCSLAGHKDVDHLYHVPSLECRAERRTLNLINYNIDQVASVQDLTEEPHEKKRVHYVEMGRRSSLVCIYTMLRCHLGRMVDL